MVTLKALSLVLFNTFINDTHNEIKSTLNKFADYMKLLQVDRTERRDAGKT